MFEGEGDKKKKVYPRLPDMLGKKDTPYYIYERYMSDCLFHNLCCLVSTLQNKQAVAWDIVLLELGGFHLAYLLTFCIIYIGIRRRRFGICYQLTDTRGSRLQINFIQEECLGRSKGELCLAL